MRGCALALLLAVGACDEHHDGPRYVGDPHWVDATAKVDGAFVVLETRCDDKYGVDALVVETKQTFRCERESHKLRIPAAKLGGAGKRTLTLGEEFRRKPPVKLDVDIPASAIVPYFNIDKCESAATMEMAFDVSVDGGPSIICWSAGAARAQLVISAPANATITLAGKTATVPASGQVTMTGDLGDSMLDLTLDEALAGGDGNPIMLPYKLTADGKELTGKIAIGSRYGEHAKLVGAWLRDIANGKIDRPAFTPPKGRMTAILLPVLGAPESSDHRGTLRDLGLLAVAKAGNRTEHGTCKLDDKKSGAITAKRILVEHVVDVVRLADGKTVAHKVFSPAPEECPFIAYVKLDNPEVENTPNSRDILAWLDTLTTAKLE